MALNQKREIIEEEYLDLADAHGEDELESEVRRAKAELDELRRKQDHIEKEKQRLEDLSRRQESMEEGKSELVERFSRSLESITRETEDCQQRLEYLKIVHANFSEHLSVLDAIHPRSWSANEVGKELNRSTAALEEARAEYNKAQARLGMDTTSGQATSDIVEYEEDTPKDFAYWVKTGFAFTLPILLFGVIALIILIYVILGVVPMK